MTITAPLSPAEAAPAGATATSSVRLSVSAAPAPGADLTGGTWVPAADRRAANAVGFTRLEFGYDAAGGLALAAALAFLRFRAPVRADGPGRYRAPFLDGTMSLATTLSSDGPRLHVEVVNPATGRRVHGWYALDRRGRHPAGTRRRAG